MICLTFDKKPCGNKSCSHAPLPSSAISKELNQRHRDAAASAWNREAVLGEPLPLEVLDKSAEELAQMMKLFEEPPCGNVCRAIPKARIINLNLSMISKKSSKIIESIIIILRNNQKSKIIGVLS